MMLDVQGEVSWAAKPGIYLATVAIAGSYKSASKGINQARIVFSLDFDDGTGLDYRVHRMYPTELRSGEALHQDIETLMGTGYLSGRKTFELEELVGKRALIQVIHLRSAGHKKPFVTFDQVWPLPKTDPPRTEEIIPAPEVKPLDPNPVVRNLMKQNQQFKAANQLPMEDICQN